MRNNFLKTLVVLSILIIAANKSALAADKLKPVMPRAGINNKIEQNNFSKKIPIASLNKRQLGNNFDLSISSLDLKSIATEINTELNDEQTYILEDLRVLWQSAVENSETIKFAILKLSNPDGEEVKTSALKKILNPVASIAPIIGVSSDSALVGSSSIFGGSLLGSLLNDENKLINHKLTKVTDADLVILAKEIDDLQQKLVELYYNYVTSIKVLEFTNKTVNNRYEYFKSAQKSSPDTISVADAFYRKALDAQYDARQNVLASRAVLEQFVGNDALVDVDKKLKDRNIY